MNQPVGARIRREPFGTLPDGTEIQRFRLLGEAGFEVAVLDLGAIVQALHVPDRNGRLADIVLGHDAPGAYLDEPRFFGAAVGRYANRIAGGRFALDGVGYRVPANDGDHALHGGPQGFDKRVWKLAELFEGEAPSLRLSLISPEGDQGFPGTLDASVTYTLSGACELTIAFEATTDAPTLVNLTHHGYFNLGGVQAGGDVLDHLLTIHADDYLPVDAAAIPLGRPEHVQGTPFDFCTPRPIGARIREGHTQLQRGRGYDHNYCLDARAAPAPRLAARVEHPGSGRVMELLTDQPGLQFYSGNFLDGTALGKQGRLYRQSDGFCLEPQTWPDAPNRADYPSARLDPGETYRHVSVYRFSAA
ncbi:aldose epimerase family protein [Ancylobacter vacuolatus]|uniref:Aldose 1-epimerase n=1 Tax=Ancylobacter vacuolatus TaxID=223389 RepID=A0ABU0DLA3_9HYPH|nr:aldose epimerase family protein [Ancylobacter vacuolatus]MDQ0349217.1 aldose 1-epimerase [Ancylobacter vacuolatus]